MQWFRDLSLRKKLILGFIVPLLLLLLTPLIYKHNADRLLDTSSWVDHTHKVIGKGYLLEKLMIDMETGKRGFLLTGQDEFLEPYDWAIDQWVIEIDQLALTVSDNPQQVAQLKKINQMQHDWLREAANPAMALRRKINNNQASDAELVSWVESKKGKNQMDAIRAELKAFIDLENVLIKQRIREAKAAAAQTQWITYLSAGVSFLLVVITLSIVSGSIAGGIGAMVQATQRVTDGDYNTRITPNSKDEIGALAQSFNTMTEKVATTQETLIQHSKMASLGSMAAGIAHEINQPLGAIAMNCESAVVCHDRDKLDVAKSLCEENVKQVSRASSIIDALRKFSREGDGSEKDIADINHLIDNILTLMSAEFKQSEVGIHTVLGENLPGILVSEIQIEQVISNLLTNARDAMENQPTKEITIQTSATSDGVYLRITDTGKGMSTEVQQRIFEPFFTTKDIGKGTGLGLSLSYGMIQSNGGEITVQSEIGKGTTFVLSFPVADSAEQASDGTNAVGTAPTQAGGTT